MSIPSNIAEGHGRLTDSQFRHFLGNARGSLRELQTQLELAYELGFLDERSWQDLMRQGNEVAKLLNALIAALGDRRSRASNSASPVNSANS